MTYKPFIDVSDYQPILKADDLRGHISALACKACEVDDQPWNLGDSLDKFVDPKLAENVQLAYDLNIPCAAYVFDNPNWTSINGGTWKDHAAHPNSGDPRILALRQALKNKTYHAICIDVERWWKSYNQYYASIAAASKATMNFAVALGEPGLAHVQPEHHEKATAKIGEYVALGVDHVGIMGVTSGTIEKIPPLWIHDSAQDLMQRIKEDQAAGILRQVPIWFYTGKWFVDAYSPELDTFLAGQLQWIADYTTGVYTSSKGKAMTWTALQTLIDAQTYNPKWIGNKRPELLQLTDAVTVPGIYNAAGAARPVDIDVALVELSKVFAPGAWSGVTPPVDPPPVVPPVDLAPIYARLDAIEAKLAKGLTVTGLAK